MILQTLCGCLVPLVLAGCVSAEVASLADEQRRYQCRFQTDPQAYVQCLKYGPDSWPDESP
ncbi:hypothetical protein [Marinobacter mobilis]|uniref:Lipoprotein n=1 Tax=Marinobacter mobilis TaxID=488533 RepID=A0A1H2WM08_9GAMM|nr:hypothetical protein [Marinobacter mobilis]SDW81662.1 hypothetical protein SAMN04487960_104212 [Marinobacter mobilis]